LSRKSVGSRVTRAIFQHCCRCLLPTSRFRIETTKNYYYDRDGTGAAAAVHFATLGNMPVSLAASDFLVI